MSYNQELIARAEAALDGVTDGPWVAGGWSVFGDWDKHPERHGSVVATTNRAPNASFIAEARDLVPALIVALKASEARVKELEEALSPFADAADEMDDYDADDGQQAPISAGDCREAHAALKGGAE